MTIQEISYKLRKINMHRLHAVRLHPEYCEGLAQRANEYWNAYQRKFIEKNY
jgi:hypothetical protein